MAVAKETGGLAERNRRVAGWAGGVAAVMLALAFASVPLYRLFCQVTGYAGTPQRAAVPSSQVLDRVVQVRLDANVGAGLNWSFEPLQRTVDVRIGETALVHYRARNIGNTSDVASATFNVSPDLAGAYFNKLECFCFTEQRLGPGESIDMPVSFFVDPAIDKASDGVRIDTIVLSYTFFPVAKPSAEAKAGAGARPAGG